MNKFQILALSGGGYRGLYTATVLKELEQEAIENEHETLADCFDLITGTSVGGIVALARVSTPISTLTISVNNFLRTLTNRLNTEFE